MKFKTRAEFYDSKRWHELRHAILRRDKYRDMIKHRYGHNVPAEVVHHIFPLDEFPEYAWAPWNLISISRSTHNTLHARDSDELTEAGKDLLRRTARRQGMEIPEKYREKEKKNEWKFGKSKRG